MPGRASLNHVYRTLWNPALGAMVAVAEIASSVGARSGGAMRCSRVADAVDDAAPPLRALSFSIFLALGAYAAHAQNLPSGGVAVHGGATFNISQPNRLTVTTTNGAGSNHSAINWNSFSIGSGNTTNFVQPSSNSLSINRVVTNTPSQLFGTLSSNGKLVLVNQSGIAVGAGAVVDTAGFTASALAMSEADAVAGRLRFGGAGIGGLTVDGNIIARGGDVVLIAPSVDVAKTALVESQGGSVVLAAGQSVEVTGRGLEGITLHVQAPTDQAINLGTLKGDAVGIFAGTLRHSGMIQAVRADMEGGKVVLRAVGDSYVEGQGQIKATSAGGKGGSVDVLGNRVAIAEQSLIDVSGQQGGGTIRVGGDFQGKNAAVQNANMTYLGPDATLKADAIDSGNGGRVIVWADQQTQGYGTISARGGAQSGDGGFVEVSGKAKLAFDARVNTLAQNGKVGTLLLDPLDILVSLSGPATLADVSLFANSPSAVFTISPSTINAAATNVVLQANRDINFAGPISMSNPGVGLTARAGQFINVNFGASITTKGGAVSFTAGDPGSLTSPSESAVYLFAPIDTTGGGAFPTGAPVNLVSSSSPLSGPAIDLRASVTAGSSNITLSGFDVAHTVGGSLTAGSLSVTAQQDILLNQPGNNIPGNVSLASNVTAVGSSSFQFNNSAPAFNLIQATSKGSVFITTAGSVSTFGSPITSSTGNISITAPTGMSLNSNITAAGTVSLTSNTSGNITQTGGFINAGGLTTATAAFGNVDLGQSSNDFNGIQVFGNSLNVRDANALNVSAFSSGSGGNVTFSAGGVLTMPFGINIATTGDIALISGGSFIQQSTLSGANIALQSSGPMALSQNITASGTLTLNDIATGGGGINQLAGNIVAAGLTTVNTSSSGNITLNQPGNDFSSIAANGGLVSLTDSTALVLNTSVVSGLNVQTNNGAVTQSGGSFLANSGISNFQTGTGSLTLNNGGNIFGTFNANTTGTVSATNALTPVSMGTVTAASFTFLSGSNVNFAPGSAITTTVGSIDIRTTSGGIELNPLVSIGATLNSAAGINLEATGNLGLQSSTLTAGGGGDVKMSSVSGLLNASGTILSTSGGRWFTYLTNPSAGHVFGPFNPTGLGTNFRQVNAPVGTAPLGVGNGSLWSDTGAPTGALTGSVTKVFDGSNTIGLAGATFVPGGGYLFGETGGSFLPGATGTMVNPNVGTGKAVTASALPLSGVQLVSTVSTPTFGYVLASATGNIGNVTPAVVSVSPISLSGIRAYDGTVIVNANIFSLSGLQGSDTLSLSGSGFVADKNVGVNKPVSLGSLVLGNGTGLASNYTFSGGNFVATITPAPIAGVVGVTADNKVYDGTTKATLQTSSATLSGLFGGDQVSISGLTGVFADRNVGTGKTVSITGATLSGADAGNYSLAGGVPAAKADIAVRPLSVWTGAAGGLWSAAGNWDALPDGNNVLAVSIPAGAGAVTFDAGTAPTNLQSLSSQRPVVVSGGSLALGSDLSLTSLGQTGGVLAGNGGLNVNGNFSQTGGSMVFGRAVVVNQVSGNLVVGDISAPAISLTAPTGGISQTAALVTPSLVIASANGAALTQSGNTIGSVKVNNTGKGDIDLNNKGSLDLAGVRTDDGDIAINNRGALTTSGLVDAPKGRVSLTANSPLTIGMPGIMAGSDVNLTATNQSSSGDLRVDGPVTSGGAVTMTASHDLTQNTAIVAANGVTATANGAISYGPGAFSSRAPVLYSQNGVRITPPPSSAQSRSEATNAAPDAVVAFLETFERTQLRLVDTVFETNADGTPVKRRDPGAVVTEGNVCAR